MAFAALVVAWVCANSPQSAVFQALVWLKSANHFSHQARLVESVADLLNGASERKLPAVAETKSKNDRPPATPALSVITKVELATVHAKELAGRVANEVAWLAASRAFPQSWRAEPPVPPPRSRAAVC